MSSTEPGRDQSNQEPEVTPASGLELNKPLDPVYVDQLGINKDGQEGEILVGPDGKPIIGPDGRPLRRRKRKKQRNAKDYTVWIVLLGVFIGAILVGYWQVSLSAGSRGTPVQAFSSSPAWQFQLDRPRPGQSFERCFTISAGGLSPMNMRFYLVNKPVAYESTYALQITRGQQSSDNSSGSCAGFKPDRKSYIGLGPGVVFQGGANELSQDPAEGFFDPNYDERKVWVKGDSSAYRVRLLVTGKQVPVGLRASIVFEPRLAGQAGRASQVLITPKTPRLPGGNARCKKIRDEKLIDGYWLSASLKVPGALGTNVRLTPSGENQLLFTLSGLRPEDLKKISRLPVKASSFGRPIALTRQGDNWLASADALEGGNNDLVVEVGPYRGRFSPLLKVDDFGVCVPQ